MFAAMDGETATARKLLDAGASVNQRNANGQTALMWASLMGHTDAVRLLLERGADARVTDVAGWTAERYAKNDETKRALRSGTS